MAVDKARPCSERRYSDVVTHACRYGNTHKPVLLRSLLCERQLAYAKRSEARLSAAACERAQRAARGRRLATMADASSTRSLLLAAAAGAALAAACTAIWLAREAREDGETTLRRARPSQQERALRRAGSADTHAAAGCGDGVLGAVGNTPLVRIASLSEATGCEARVHSPSCCAPTAQRADALLPDLRQSGVHQPWREREGPRRRPHLAGAPRTRCCSVAATLTRCAGGARVRRAAPRRPGD